MAKQLTVADIEKAREWEDRYYRYKKLVEDIANKSFEYVNISKEDFEAAYKKDYEKAMASMLTKKA